MSGSNFDSLRHFELQDDERVLRRFLTMAKFRHLLESCSLYLAPACDFSDELEGHYTFLDYKMWDAQLRQWGFATQGLDMASSAKAAVARHNQAATVISCWTTTPADDPRMWREYAGSPYAVVVETTGAAMRAALDADFLLVEVQYVDFDTHAISKEHSFQPFFCKRESYSWEQEVRVIAEMEMGNRVGTPRLIPASVSILIKRIILDQAAGPAFTDEVSDLVTEHVPGVEITVVPVEWNI
jgi:hypothetical protein